MPTYDIVMKEGKNFMWVDAAHDIQSAKRRVYELSRHRDVEFVIFDEHTLQLVSTFETPIPISFYVCYFRSLVINAFRRFWPARANPANNIGIATGSQERVVQRSTQL
jgi:hypothetical protein